MDEPRFPNLIRRMRERSGLKTFELAAKMGRPSSFVSRLETGGFKETPPPDVLTSLAKALGVSVAEQLDALGYPVTSEEAPPVIHDPLVRAIAEAVARLSESDLQTIRTLVDRLAEEGETEARA